jgi:DNA polymerase III alpha subunit|tara:strand:- start:24 stop:449 length:426 start_codon:yes stop_codon:yes gene_type:complete
MITLNPSNWFSFMTKSHEEEDSTDWLNRVINELANPLDSMPIATNDNKYAPPERRAELDAEMLAINSEPVVETTPTWFNVDKEDGLDYEGPVDEVEEVEEESIHEKMYQIATSKYNPFSVGGSENIQDFDERLGGSENRLS